ncbi:sugar ABC transporter substrate-binding protein [Laedolimicola ammoniilytica]|uniref:Sugar ABC transporter substrate-binding protein n=1 Tax=Laedolimicola ammoniilytica TaxID=2981771 RepID=A0ABT2S0P4_9FIRM|nr:sugar ABC transporter substrate-binding protein [Laedolimicola ammoniilytica]MCU6698160.1 sugar ABC transporter substrate-binding protein [Laedolimicola ammoniilytica]SCH13833.1 ABC-type sugar transport system%2C periplasmic component [uncultured Clostridium sp.]SCI66319.1 ABC-type sugar transport system%2C periplasmic component [uncultured Clostridium sp.]
MNKLFKKVTATALAATMVLGMTACGGSKDTTTADSSSSAATETPAAATDNKDIKIGVSIWSSTDVLGSQCKLILDEAAKALGVQVQYVDQGHVSEKVTASVEQLVAAGCQGIIICNSSDTEMTSAIKTCNDNKVYLAQFFRVISKDNSADIYQMATDSAYYIGAVHEDEPANGEELVNILLEKGDRNIGLIGWEQGDATWLGRWEGYKAGVEKWNEANPDDKATLSEPQYAGTTSEGGSKAAEALMAADPNLDALIPAGGGGDPLQGAIAAVERAGKTQDIDIVSTDFLPDLGERLENGSMAGESGGHYCDPLIAFMMVYNAIKGNYTDFAGKFEDVPFPYLYVSSADDYKAYEQYFVDQLPYTDEELVAMSELDLAGLKEAAAKVSIEDAAARAGK